MKKILIYLETMIILVGCNDNTYNINEKSILSNIEKGTDSTYKHEYFSNNSKSLYCTLSSYYSSKIATFVSYYDVDKLKVRQIETIVEKKRYGHYFEFYENGNLKTYCYYVGNGNDSHLIRKYNTAGKLESEEGTPYVDYIVDDDNASADIFFSNVFCDSLIVEASTISKIFFKIPLKKSSMQPFLLEGKVPLNLLFLKITTVEQSKNVKTFYDTLRLKK